MEKAKLYNAHPAFMEARHIEEARKLSYQQRFDKLMAIIEVSNMLRNAKIIKSKNSTNE